MLLKTMDSITHDVIYNGTIDEIAILIGQHRGDVRAVIRSLLDDRKRLQERLALADISMNVSLTNCCSPQDCI